MLLNKVKDTFGVNFQVPDQPTTKRGMMKFLASIYNPACIISPVMLLAEDMYREACDRKLSWDKRPPKDLMKRWTKWIKCFPHPQIELPRSIPMHNEKIQSVTLHVFADTSSKGVCAAVYAVLDQLKEKSQGLLTSKSRASKKNLTIPRLELTAAHMATNLLSNAKIALRKYPVSNCYRWSDSTTVLFWFQDNNGYKQFVSNRVQKIKQQSFLQWNYVPTTEDSADIGGRECKGIDIKIFWTNGLSWLPDRENWPKQITIQASQESDNERHGVKNIFKAAVSLESNMHYQLLERFNLKKTLRILSWVQRFTISCKIKKRKKRSKGPLTTKEINLQLTKMIRDHQSRSELDPAFNESKKH